jgi:hypothetical protein
MWLSRALSSSQGCLHALRASPLPSAPGQSTQERQNRVWISHSLRPKGIFPLLSSTCKNQAWYNQAFANLKKKSCSEDGKLCWASWTYFMWLKFGLALLRLKIVEHTILVAIVIIFSLFFSVVVSLFLVIGWYLILIICRWTLRSWASHTTQLGAFVSFAGFAPRMYLFAGTNLEVSITECRPIYRSGFLTRRCFVAVLLLSNYNSNLRKQSYERGVQYLKCYLLGSC